MPKRQPDPPLQPTYFLDENTRGPRMCELLRGAGLVVEDIDDHFQPTGDNPSVLDTEWIPQVAARGWWAVTKDRAIITTKREIAAHRDCESVLLIIRGHKMKLADMANALINAHERLRAFIPTRIRPMIIYVTADGRLTLREGGERRGGAKRD